MFWFKFCILFVICVIAAFMLGGGIIWCQFTYFKEFKTSIVGLRLEDEKEVGINGINIIKFQNHIVRNP